MLVTVISGYLYSRDLENQTILGCLITHRDLLFEYIRDPKKFDAWRCSLISKVYQIYIHFIRET